mgnify:CR=1 FL=1
MNFILPHSFELDLRRECHYLVHRSFSFGVIQIRRSVQKLSSLGSPSADLFEREGFYFTDCSVIRFIDAQERLSLLCFYTGEASRLWWASVLLLSEPRQSVRTVRVPYRPSVFAPFCLKSAGLALIWASAVLLWFLALLYTRGRGLSIRRMHNKLDIIFQETTKKCIVRTSGRQEQPPCAVWTARRAFCGKPLHKNCQTSSAPSSAAVSRTPGEPISYIINR